MSNQPTFMQRLRGISADDLQKSSYMPIVNNDAYKNYVSSKQSIGDNIYDDNTVQKSAVNMRSIPGGKAITDPGGAKLLGTIAGSEPGLGFARKLSREIPRNTNSTLRFYSDNPIIASIVNTRVNQVVNYSQPARLKQDGVGFRIRKANGESPTKSEQQKIDMCEKFIINMGRYESPEVPDFTSFLRSLTHDTLIYDQVNTEKVWYQGQLDHINLIDPCTIYLTVDPKNNQVVKKGKVYSQVINQHIERQFTHKEMGMFTRNRPTDLSRRGYGYSELEQGLHEVRNYENADKFNGMYFTNGGTVRGVLLIKDSGNTNEEALQSLKRVWNSAVGIQGAWKTPVIQADDAKFVNLTPDAQDMQFEKWFTYLVNVLCSIYSIDPSEIGMANRGGATGTHGSTLNESSNRDKISQSKDKGLTPLLSQIANFITKDIIHALVGTNYTFEFVGGDLENRIRQASLTANRVQTNWTINESRAAEGLKPIKGGDIIANGTYIQRLGQLDQEEAVKFQQQQQIVQQLNQAAEMEVAQPEAQDMSGVSYQDMQAGMTGKPAKPSGKANQEGVGKDGQLKNEKNANSFKGSAKKK